MAGIFPQSDWLKSLEDYLNSNEKYAQVAKKWEGDLVFEIKADGPLTEDVNIYLDLWHGKCRKSSIMKDGETVDAAFIMTAPYSNFVRVLKGDLDSFPVISNKGEAAEKTLRATALPDTE